jgi:hypothetical protein
MTSDLSSSIATLLSLDPSNKIIDFLTRAFFFSMNLSFNALMWALFTAALARGDSTTRVSVINVSANFLVTAVAGAVVFGEDLRGWWFLGAGLLVAGSVVIGRRDGDKQTVGRGSGERDGVEAEELMGERDEAGLVEFDHASDNGRPGGVTARTSVEEQEQKRLRTGVDADDPI